MATPEGKIKAAVNKLLDGYKSLYRFMPVPGGFGASSLDYLVCVNGQFLAIETKAPGKRGQTTPNQERRIDEIKIHGGWAIVVDDAKQLIEYINSEGS